MIIGFTGSRSITKLTEEMQQALFTINEDDTVVHGGAVGADKLVAEYLGLNRHTQKVIRPINPSNKMHYLYRNVEIVTMCDKLIAFWDGSSRGTKFTIDYAKSRGKEVIIIKDERR